MKRLFPTLLTLLFSASLFAQNEKLPQVFQIGAHETAYEKAMDNYNKSLLDVCNSDMGRAFELWMTMSLEMESYASQMNFDLNGVRAWFHVLFSADGKINHLAFHLKPDSKNVDTEALTGFLSGFCRYYKLPISGTAPFSHYTSVVFPTMYAPMGQQ